MYCIVHLFLYLNVIKSICLIENNELLIVNYNTEIIKLILQVYFNKIYNMTHNIDISFKYTLYLNRYFLTKHLFCDTIFPVLMIHLKLYSVLFSSFLLFKTSFFSTSSYNDARCTCYTNNVNDRLIL